MPLLNSLHKSINGFTPSVPRYGLTVTISSLKVSNTVPLTLTFPICPVAYAVDVDPISPRLISPITTRPLYETVGAKVNEWAQMSMDGEYSNVGAVVGATYPEMGEVLRKIMPNSYILVPGYGAQGGKGSDLKPFFNSDGLGAIVNSSRGIIAAYKQEQYAKYGEENFAEAARAAVIAMQKDIAEGAGL